MSNINKRPVRRAAAGVLAGTLALTGGALVAGVSPASADEGFDLRRVAGDNRYQTSADIAAEFGDSTSAILASGESGRFADALSANFLAGVQGGPVLLTTRAATPQVILDALEDAGVTDITLVGGTDVISLAQEMALEADGYTVTRLGGVDRFATSQLVIDAADDVVGDISNIGLIASGINFPDALAAGSLSYAGNHPLGLVRANLVPDETLEALEDAGVDSVIIIGGTTVVGTEVEDQLEDAGIDIVTRLSGDDRSETSVAVAEYLLTREEFTDTTFNVASGAQALDGVDALGGAALSGEQGRALLITNTATAAGAVDDFAADNIETLDEEGLVFGGTAAVSQAVVDAIVAAGDDVPPVTTNQTFTVTGQEAATNTVSDGTTTNANRGARVYTATGLAAGAYDIRLFPAENVVVDANGVVSFTDNNEGTAPNLGNNEADVDADAVDAVIEVVNGAAQTTPGVLVEEVSPVGGTISFTIDSEVSDSVVPVLFIDTEDDDTVELDANNQPTEAFGVGGVKSFVPAEQATGDITAADIVSVDKADDVIITADDLYEYDANDTFFIDGYGPNNEPGGGFTVIDQVTLTQFEAELSAGDNIDGFYQANTELSSRFELLDNAPAAPAAVDAALETDGRTIEVTFDESDTTSVDNYNVYRAELTDAEREDIADETLTEAEVVAALADSRYTLLDTVADNNPTTDVFEYLDDSTEFDNTYAYAVSSVDGDEESARTEDSVPVATLAEERETVAPTVLDTRIVTDFGADAVINTGDVITIQFSETMNATTATGVFRFTDPDGEIFQITLGGTSTNTAALEAGNVNADTDTTDPGEANSRLRITLGATGPVKVGGPAVEAGSANEGAQVPGTITVFGTQFDDAAGNQVNLAGSTDVVIDNEL